MIRTTDAWRYGLAVSGVAAAVLAEVAVDAFVDSTSPYPVIVAAVLAAAWFGGRGPGLLATGLGAAAGYYLFPPPTESWFKPAPAQVLPMLTFVLAGAILTWLVSRLRIATRQAEEQREQFRLLVESTGDCAGFFLAADGRVSSWNEGAERVFGYRADEIVGSPLARFAADVKAGAAGLGLPPAGGRAEGEGWLARRGGARFWGEWVVSGQSGDAGPGSGFVAVVWDSTGKWRAEEAERRSEHRLSLILEAASEGAWDWTVPTGEVYYSPRWMESLGYSPDEVPPHLSFWEGLVHPDDMVCVREALRDHFDGRTPTYHCETRVRTKAGGWRWYLNRGRVVERDAGGNPVRMVGANTDISDRKWAEDQLRASESRFKTLAGEAPVGIFRTDAEGNCLFVNDRWCRMAGMSPDMARGQGWAAALHPEDRERVFSEWYKAAREETEFADEYRFRTPAGQVTWLSGRAAALRDEAGTVTGYIGTVTDISARRAAEEAVRAGRQQLQLMADALPVLIAYIDKHRRYRFNNAAYERWFGLSREAIKGLSLPGVLGEAAYEAVRGYVDAVLAGAPQAFEGRVPFQGAGTRDVHVDFIPHRDDQGEVAGFYALIADVSDRQRAEEALRASERRFALFMQYLPGLAWIKDLTGRYVYANAAAERAFRTERADLYGKTDEQVFPPGTAAKFRENDMQALAGPGGVQVVETLADGDGAARHSLVNKFPIPGADGRPAFIGGMAIDITDRKELEREVLEAAAAEQRRIGQELHDTVGQELTGLSLLAAALAKRASDRDPAGAATAARIVEELGRVHQQVRALSRGLVPVEVDPEGLRAALEELAARTADGTGTECAFECEGPADVDDAGTATHLLRIAQEAVSNALRHGHPGRIRIALRGRPSRLILEVRDDGVGIPQGPAGLGGLGIRLMRYRAGIIGGSLAVAPSAGGGTLVRCVLPRRDASVVE